MDSPPRSKYRKHPSRKTSIPATPISPIRHRYDNVRASLPKISYSAILNTFTTPVNPFLRQNHSRKLCAMTSQSSSPARPAGSFSLGRRYSVNMTASEKATDMPPPVRGWRMFQASPTMMTPDSELARPCIEGGRKEFGMVRRRWDSRDLIIAGCTFRGRNGM